MNKIKQIASNKKSVAKLLLVLLVLVALPVTLILVRQSQDTRSEASYDTTAYIEEGGRVVIEAETYDDYQTNGTNYNWTKKDDGKYPEYPTITLYYMQSLPNDTTTLYNQAPSPELKYNIWITNPGTYYAYIRSSAPGANADSIHIGIDGGQKTNMATYYIGKYGYQSNWDWEGNGGPVALNISTPGLHTFNIWARETGAKIDRINLTKDKNWAPENHSNRGPGASTRSTVTVGTPTPIPCIKQDPQVDIIGESNKDVIQEETVEFTVRVTNRNSAECAPEVFNMSTLFNPTTSDIDYTFSETSFTLNSGESRDVLATFTPGKEVAGSSVTAAVTATEAASNKSFTANLTMNVIVLTTLNFNKIILHGIGIGGDNVNPTGGGNPNPLTTTKTLNVRFFDAGGNVVAEESGDITFSNTNGYFSGSFSTNSRLDSIYTIKIRTHKYLWHDLIGIHSIVEGEENDMPDSELTVGDINSDEKIKIDDYEILVGCYSDLLPAENCTGDNKFNSDLTDDGNVNQDDYNLLLREWSNQPGA